MDCGSVEDLCAACLQRIGSVPRSKKLIACWVAFVLISLESDSASASIEDRRAGVFNN